MVWRSCRVSCYRHRAACLGAFVLHAHVLYAVDAVHAHGKYMPLTPAAAKLGPLQPPRPFYILILLGGTQIGGIHHPNPIQSDLADGRTENLLINVTGTLKFSVDK